MVKVPTGRAQSYTAQAVTAADQIMGATAGINDQNDNGALKPMLTQRINNLRDGGHGGPESDPGHWDSDEIEEIERTLHIATLVATGRTGRVCSPIAWSADACHSSSPTGRLTSGLHDIIPS